MRASFLFFAFFAYQAVPGRFSSLFLQAHEQSPAEIGIAFATGNIVSIAATPLISLLADRAESRTGVILWLQVVSTLTFLLHAFVLPSVTLLPSRLQFPFLLIVRGLFSSVNKPILPIVTAICVAQLREKHGPSGPTLFGQERVWGTYSWAGMSVILGALLDIPNAGVWVVYLTKVILSSLFVVLLISSESPLLPSSLSRNIINNRSSTSASNHDRTSISFLQTAHDVMFKEGLSSISFFALIAILSIGTSVVLRFQFLYFYDELGSTNFMCGLAVLLTVLFEIPMFAHAPYLLQRFGAVNLSAVAALAYAVRSMGYAFAPNGWIVLLLEPLHGVTHAALQASAVAYIAQRAPPGADATAQAILSLVRSISAIAGLGFGGIVMQIAGGRVLYFCTGILTLIVTIAFVLTQIKLNSSRLLDRNVTDDEQVPCLSNEKQSTP